ncbi:siderophore-interacting protein [Yinghuangia soli]|uniref:Siderophore-interacting protein n=1 Tax=Yinghuangia soli TaxID=2908204 RepID=A0AA41U7M1_9ACTN|nr:siderophore-interacting protein [Yinghuangia soli]MCF2532079.1 siderophore-interacting protein [Yinghuangia soli]
MTTPELPYRFFDLTVLRADRIGPDMVRVTFGGEDLKAFVSDGRDQRLKIFLPHPGQDAPVVPVDAGEDWFAQWMAVPAETRAVMRTYTVRDARREPDEVDVDFALHGDLGPASRWAQKAAPGDRVVVIGPSSPANGGVDFELPDGTDWVLVTADETALPAVEGILRWLPAGLPAKVWISVPHEGDRRELPTEADAEVTWLVRDGADALPAAVEAAELPEGTPYAWIAGEAGSVKAVRRNLVRDRGFDRKSVTFTGYWRRGATDDDLLAETLAGGTPHLPEDDEPGQ